MRSRADGGGIGRGGSNTVGSRSQACVSICRREEDALDLGVTLAPPSTAKPPKVSQRSAPDGQKKHRRMTSRSKTEEWGASRSTPQLGGTHSHSLSELAGSKRRQRLSTPSRAIARMTPWLATATFLPSASCSLRMASNTAIESFRSPTNAPLRARLSRPVTGEGAQGADWIEGRLRCSYRRIGDARGPTH